MTRAMEQEARAREAENRKYEPPSNVHIHVENPTVRPPREPTAVIIHNDDTHNTFGEFLYILREEFLPPGVFREFLSFRIFKTTF